MLRCSGAAPVSCTHCLAPPARLPRLAATTRDATFAPPAPLVPPPRTTHSKWAFALNRMSLARGDHKYNRWAVQAGGTASSMDSSATTWERSGGGEVTKRPAAPVPGLPDASSLPGMLLTPVDTLSTWPAALPQLIEATYPHFVHGSGSHAPRMWWKVGGGVGLVGG